jgi:DNA-binding CsgD family transcriptional regulator
MGGAAATQGVIVVDASLRVVASNPEVLHILTYPDRPDEVPDLDACIVNKIRSRLTESQLQPGIVGEVRSARRTYLCRYFSLDLVENHRDSSTQSGKLLIVIMERKSNGASTIAEACKSFGLTVRELETVRFLLEGFTSKEIAQRMNISANTVKAFIRLVMTKMNVSTRSGIVGKVACSRS